MEQNYYMSSLPLPLSIQHRSGPHPTQWNPKDRPSNVELTSSNLRAIYRGTGASDSEASCVRANHPVPLFPGLFYFEVCVISKGRDGYIGIGLCAKGASLHKLPGWDRHSYGYHGDDGRIYRESGTGDAYGPGFSTGDVVGCLVTLGPPSPAIHYTKNGKYLGVAFSNVREWVADSPDSASSSANNGSASSSASPMRLFPCIGLRTPLECVEVNFGARPFSFDLRSWVAAWLNSLFTSRVFELPVKSSGPLSGVGGNATSAVRDESEVVCKKLILSELVHRGSVQTAVAFAKATGLAHPPVELMQERLELMDAVERLGKPLEVVARIEHLTQRFGFSFVVQENAAQVSGLARVLQSTLRPVLDELRSLHFIELIRTGDHAQAIAFGRSCPSIASTGVYALFAYADAASVPSLQHFFSMDRRQKVASRVNDWVFAFQQLVVNSRLGSESSASEHTFSVSGSVLQSIIKQFMLIGEANATGTVASASPPSSSSSTASISNPGSASPATAWTHTNPRISIASMITEQFVLRDASRNLVASCSSSSPTEPILPGRYEDCHMDPLD